MKEIIPIKKDIIFKTKISEVTNINLEHDYKVLDDLVSGKVMLSGTYKMTEASVNFEEFFYEIPFSIALSERIKKDSVKIEIEDFKYKIEKDVMKVQIELELDCEENIIKEKTEEKEEDFILNDYENKFLGEDEILNDKKNIIDINIEEENIDNKSTIQNISSLVNNEETYSSYKVYIVRHGDTIESICNKYSINIDNLKEYNDLTNINVGDKIVIPQIVND